MASIRLGRYEIEEYELPGVCAKCGDKAVAAPAKRFSWYPPWIVVLIFVGLLLYVIVAMVLTKRMTVRLPFCERHRNYWRNRALFMYGGLLGFLLAAIAFGILAGTIDNQNVSNIFGVACGVSAVLLLVWLIVAAIMQAAGIKANEITDRSITLAALSKDFVEAIREDRRADRDRQDEDDDRPRRGRGRDDEEGDRPRAKRRPADRDDDGGYYDPDRKRRRQPDSDAYEEGDDRR